MGSAVYHMKARVDESQVEPIKAFIAEGIGAYEFWQENRGKTPDEFWPEFREKFPLVTEYLKSMGMDVEAGDNSNSLAGNLDFGNEGDEEDIEYSTEKGELHYASEVWHFANWSPFMAFLESHFGAEKTGWLSDEYINPGDLIDLDIDEY